MRSHLRDSDARRSITKEYGGLARRYQRKRNDFACEVILGASGGGSGEWSERAWSELGASARGRGLARACGSGARPERAGSGLGASGVGEVGASVGSGAWARAWGPGELARGSWWARCRVVGRGFGGARGGPSGEGRADGRGRACRVARHRHGSFCNWGCGLAAQGDGQGFRGVAGAGKPDGRRLIKNPKLGLGASRRRLVVGNF